MADNTKIEWADATLNYVNGCSLESPGCTNCYAMKQAHRFPVRQGLTVKTKGGMVWTGEVRENPRALEQALAWKRGRAIFWNAHGDLFHPSVPDEWIDRQFAAFALTPQHRHMVLTKRSERMREYLSHPDTPFRIARAMAVMVARPGGPEELRPVDAPIDWPLRNVWAGVSVEDQTRADERIPNLLATPAVVRFISAEPLLGPVDLMKSHYELTPTVWLDTLDWVIVGGESGPGARAMHPDWARSLRDQCAAAGVAFHFKQWGEFVPATCMDNGDGLGTVCYVEDGSEKNPDFKGRRPITVLDGQDMWRVGKKRAGRLLDGVEHNGVPAHG